MMIQHFYLEFTQLIFMIFFGFLFLWYHKRQERLKRTTFDLLDLLDRHVDVINKISKKHKAEEVRNYIDFYSNFQMILKMSSANFISYFKYDYSKRFIVSNFIFTITDNGEIIHESNNSNLPVTSNLLLLNLLHTDDKDLYRLDINSLSGKTGNMRDMYMGINTIYYQNIYKEERNPFGYMVLSYKKENFELPMEDKEQIMRILKDIKRLI